MAAASCRSPTIACLRSPRRGWRAGVTVSFACEFLDAAREGELIECDGEITRAGGSLIFLRGVLRSGERALFTFSGTIKRVKEEAGGRRRRCHLKRPNPSRLARLSLLLALACCWSSTYPLTKIGLGSFPPITFISARSLIAAAFLFVILRLRGIRMPMDRGLEAVRAAADHQFDVSVSADHLGAAICAGVVDRGAGLDDADLRVSDNLGHTRHEPATLLKLAGAILGLAGTAVIVGLDALSTLDTNVFAEIVILLATISFACATIFGCA